MSNTELNTDSNRVPATIAWNATETDAYAEPPFADEAFCIQLVVLNGDRHIYRVDRETLTQLSGRISHILGNATAAEGKQEVSIVGALNAAA